MSLRKAAQEFEAHLRTAGMIPPPARAKAQEAVKGTHLMVNARDEQQLWDGLRYTLAGLRDTAKALGDRDVSQTLHRAYIAVWKVR
jgi:hypothetical protein